MELLLAEYKQWAPHEVGIPEAPSRSLFKPECILRGLEICQLVPNRETKERW